MATKTAQRLLETRNDLPLDVRTKVVSELAPLLAAITDALLRAKHAHWNVKGPNFIALHELFDEVAERLSESVDTVAERIVQLGGIASGLVGEVARDSGLPAYPSGAVKWSEHVEGVASSLAAAAKLVRKGIDVADDLGDMNSADVLTEVCRQLDKDLWFVESHLVD